MAAGRDQLVIGEPCDPGRATPLRIASHLAEGLVLRHPLMLDALLIWSVAAEHRLLPPVPGEPHPRIEIPVVRADGHDFHLCSEAHAVAEEYEVRYKNRRAPVQEMARLGSSKIKRVDIAVGPNKSYRVPYELTLLRGDVIEWWCLGDPDRIRVLLSRVHYLGKHRGSGKGRLDIHGQPWTVEECEPWDGFPVLRDGLPLRPLPLDWPGVRADAPRGFRVLTPPYYDHTREELLACPS